MKFKLVVLTGLFFISFSLMAECLDSSSCTDENYNKCKLIAEKESESQKKKIGEQFFLRCSGGSERNVEDYKKSLKWYQQGARLGNKESQHALGFIYEKGFGVTKNYATAAKWYLKAANQGYAASQRMLAYFYQEGIGVTQDYVESYMWENISNPYGNDFDNKFLYWLSNNMTDQQIEKAQQRARDWLNKNKQ
ncbi:MAG: sel1 repeat family protein [Gammaproteobacteria bacterium]|nr:sel1 repeat family protein [Gammaproteobacteria bacterium]